CNLAGQEQGIVQREHMAERPEANPMGPLGGRREQRQRVRRDAKLLEKVMLDHRIGIEADGIRMLDLAHDLPGQIRIGLVQGRLHFRVDAETHRWSPQLERMLSGSSRDSRMCKQPTIMKSDDVDTDCAKSSGIGSLNASNERLRCPWQVVGLKFG